MKITVEFDDTEDAKVCIDGVKWKMSVWDLDQWLRSKIKHAPDGMSDGAYDAYEECRDKLHDILYENGLILD